MIGMVVRTNRLFFGIPDGRVTRTAPTSLAGDAPNRLASSHFGALQQLRGIDAR
jgi:hypothetical protein